MSKEPLLLKALHSKNDGRPPVWLMRQAGRYLKEYQELKSQHSFLDLCTSTELALKVSLQPISAFNMDAAIVFSDILMPFTGMGIEFTFAPGPIIKNPITSPNDINLLSHSDPYKHTPCILETISLLKRELRKASEQSGDQKAVIGFSGAPWTLANYIIKQEPYKQFHATSVFAQEHKKAIRALLERLTLVIIDYVSAQIEAGADVIQLFDTWAGNLSTTDYENLALPYTARIIQAIQKMNCPCILFAGNTAHIWKSMAQSGANCLSLDWRVDLSLVSSELKDSISLQGNLDPAKLFGTKTEVIEHVDHMLYEMQNKKNYIANLGHGVLQNTPRENVLEFVNRIKSFEATTNAGH